MKTLKNRNVLGSIILLVVIITFLGAAYYNRSRTVMDVSYTKFLEKVDEKLVTEVTITETAKIKFKMKDMENTFTTENPRNPQLKETLLLKDIKVIEGSDVTTISLIQTFVSILFFVGAFYFVYKTTNKNNMKSAFALSVTDANEEKKITLSFADIAGNEEAKESVEDIVDFIKNPLKYSKYGARMPRGIIFYGSPGTGKTLMAKAIAGEAGVPFFAVSGSDFVQMYVGVGASRIRDLFKRAREVNRAVIFIDEIDALGKKRSSGVSGGNDERDQTLNALLTEMSGFSSGDGIIVIAATNRLDTLDEALLRPGRFDRQIEIGLPDVKARERIITLYGKDKPISAHIDYGKVAKDTVYFSGAMLENLLNEAAILAAKRNSDEIEIIDIDKAYYTILAGSEKKDRSNIMDRDRKVTAFHEAGHALVARLVSPENTVTKITIIPSTKGAGGFCVNIAPDKMYYTKKELEAQIMINFAGRAAEELIFGADNITTGASNDIEKASSIIKDYVTKYGMGSKTGLLNMNMFRENNTVINECISILETLYADTKKIITEHMEKLHGIAEELLEKETLNEDDLIRIV